MCVCVQHCFTALALHGPAVVPVLELPAEKEGMLLRQAVAKLREDGQQWQIAPPSCNSQQHLEETEGWTESWRCLKEAISNQGPFDGVMGFSQVKDGPDARC